MTNNETLRDDIYFNGIFYITIVLGFFALIHDVGNSADVFSNIKQELSLTIAVFTAGAALAGLYALIFRSIQTGVQIDKAEEQIGLTRQQNDFSNYFKHLEEFRSFIQDEQNSDLLDLRIKTNKLDMLKPRMIHKALFGTIDSYTIRVNATIIDVISIKSKLLYQNIMLLSFDEKSKYRNVLKELSNDYKGLCQLLSIETRFGSQSHDKTKSYASFQNVTGALITIHETLNIVRYILTFTGEVIPLNCFNAICQMELKKDVHPTKQRMFVNIMEIDDCGPEGDQIKIGYIKKTFTFEPDE